MSPHLDNNRTGKNLSNVILLNSSRPTCIIGVPGEEREKEKRIYEQVMAKILRNLTKDMNINNQGAQQMPSKTNSKRCTLKHIIIKFSKDKEKIDKLDFMKIKICVSQDTINRVKG